MEYGNSPQFWGEFGTEFGFIPRCVWLRVVQCALFLVLLPNPLLLWHVSVHFWPYQVFWDSQGVQIASKRFFIPKWDEKLAHSWKNAFSVHVSSLFGLQTA